MTVIKAVVGPLLIMLVVVYPVTIRFTVAFSRVVGVVMFS